MIVTYPDGTKRFISYGRQDSEYDNTLSGWGGGDIHPSRRLNWWKVLGLAICCSSAALVIVGICKLFHRF